MLFLESIFFLNFHLDFDHFDFLFKIFIILDMKHVIYVENTFLYTMQSAYPSILWEEMSTIQKSWTCPSVPTLGMKITF